MSWWRAEGDATDSAGTNNGTALNGSGYAAGESGQAFSLAGANNCIQVPYSRPLSCLQTIPVEAWIKPTAQVTNYADFQYLIFGQSDGACQLVVRPGTTGVHVAFQIGVNGSTFYILLSAPMKYPLNQFTHVVGAWDGTTLKLYLNGTFNAQPSPWSNAC